MSIVNMLSRMFMQRMLRWGIRSGTDAIARRGAGKAGAGKAGTGAAGKMAQAERAQARNMRVAVKRARQAARVTRRLGR